MLPAANLQLLPVKAGASVGQVVETRRQKCVITAAATAIVERFYTLVHSRTSLARIRDVFHRVDADGDGKVCPAELHAACSELGVHLTRGELDMVWPRLDLDGNGSLSYSEFIAIVKATKLQPRATAAQLYSESVANLVEHAFASDISGACVEALLGSMGGAERGAAARAIERAGRDALTVTFDEEERDRAHRLRLQWSNYDPLEVAEFVARAREAGSVGVERVLVMVAKRLSYRQRAALVAGVLHRSRQEESGAGAVAKEEGRRRRRARAEVAARNRALCASASPFSKQARVKLRLRELELARKQLSGELWAWNGYSLDDDIPPPEFILTGANPIPAPFKASSLRHDFPVPQGEAPDGGGRGSSGGRPPSQRGARAGGGGGGGGSSAAQQADTRPRTAGGKLRLEQRLQRNTRRARTKLRALVQKEQRTAAIRSPPVGAAAGTGGELDAFMPPAPLGNTFSYADFFRSLDVVNKQ